MSSTDPKTINRVSGKKVALGCVAPLVIWPIVAVILLVTYWCWTTKDDDRFVMLTPTEHYADFRSFGYAAGADDARHGASDSSKDFKQDPGAVEVYLAYHTSLDPNANETVNPGHRYFLIMDHPPKGVEPVQLKNEFVQGYAEGFAHETGIGTQALRWLTSKSQSPR